MRIALVGRHVHGNGGAPHYMSALAKALAPCHEVTVFSARFEGLEGSGVHHRRVWALGALDILWEVTFFIAVTLMLWWSRLTMPNKFDIIHSHHYGSPFFSQVMTSHYCEREALARVSRPIARLPGARFLQTLRGQAWAWVEKRLFGGARRKALVAPSESTRRDLLRHYRAAGGPIFVVAGGVDPVRYSPDNIPAFRRQTRRRHALAEGDVVVLLVGGDHERKGVAQAVEAVARIRSSRVHLMVVGPGQCDPYRALARDRGVEGRVIFAGSQEETWKYYAASDIFLLPTVYEAFGLSVLEAMATGLPVVVSREAGAAELIRDGIDGLLLEDPLDVAEIAAKLELLLADAGLGKRLGEKARRTALQYTWSHVAERTVEVYQRVLGQPTGYAVAVSVASLTGNHPFCDWHESLRSSPPPRRK